jgi:hypothetical protein
LARSRIQVTTLGAAALPEATASDAAGEAKLVHVPGCAVEEGDGLSVVRGELSSELAAAPTTIHASVSLERRMARLRYTALTLEQHALNSSNTTSCRLTYAHAVGAQGRVEPVPRHATGEGDAEDDENGRIQARDAFGGRASSPSARPRRNKRSGGPP